MARLHQPLFENEGESIKIKIDGHFAKSFKFFGFSKIEQNVLCLKKFDGMTFIYKKNIEVTASHHGSFLKPLIFLSGV